jgi:DNA-binding response OmpR family regulator
LRILIVEDNADVANSLADLLKSDGFEDVDISPDGETALASIRRSVPDLVLCDLGLPGSIDGFGVARACRREQRLQHVRLIALSGIGDTEARTKALAAGFDDLLSKPIRLSVLGECVRRTPNQR